MKKVWLVLLLALPLGCTPPAEDGGSGDSGSTAAAPADASLTQQS